MKISTERITLVCKGKRSVIATIRDTFRHIESAAELWQGWADSFRFHYRLVGQIFVRDNI